MMLLRRLALLSAVVAPLGVIWVACSVPGASSERIDQTCVEGCPEGDASTDAAADTNPIGIDANPDGPGRNARCGTSGCLPDRDQALWTCGGSLIQQGASTRPDASLSPQPLGDGSFGGAGGEAGAA
ncbi:MAG: hypothetical protein EOO75_08050, partial [Myxococcales bacterium]